MYLLPFFVEVVGEAGLETAAFKRAVNHACPWDFQGFRVSPTLGTGREVMRNDGALGNWGETETGGGVRKGLPETGRIGMER